MLLSPVLVYAVINSAFASRHTNATFELAPRSPIKPMSTVGEPVAVDAKRINGSSIVTISVLTVVVLPLTVRFPEIVRSDPYVKLFANLFELIE